MAEFVITATGHDNKVVSLAYIAPFAPDTGQSAGSLGATAAPAPMGAEIRADKNGLLSLTEAGVKENFAQDLSALEKDIQYAVQAPTAAALRCGLIWRVVVAREVVK
jgi:hypothetical protein